MIDANTQLYGVIGNPVAHSLSPLMHNRAFAHSGFNGVFVAFPVENVEDAVCGIRALGIRGASVTIPHKISIMDFLDEIDETAHRIGAVNTVVNRGGRLSGYNTDAPGAIGALKQRVSIRGKNVYIIGAGGAARAIGFGLVSEGAKVRIVNRTLQKGEELAGALGAGFSLLKDDLELDCDILINTTPVGMTPHTESMPIPATSIRKETAVMDIVYNPLRTRLLRAAADKGCATVEGIGMFVYQGAHQFKLWTGQEAPIDIMRDAVMEALGGQGRQKSEV
jgi:shikimate dehydrogenase